MRQKIPIIIGVILCILSVHLAGLHAGFEFASQQNRGIFSTYGTGYQLLAKCYTYVTVLALIFIGGKKLKSIVVSHIVCTCALILTLFQLRTIYLQKSLFFEDSDRFTELMRMTIPSDRTIFILVLVLLIIQIITFIQEFLMKYQKIR